MALLVKKMRKKPIAPIILSQLALQTPLVLFVMMDPTIIAKMAAISAIMRKTVNASKMKLGPIAPIIP